MIIFSPGITGTASCVTIDVFVTSPTSTLTPEPGGPLMAPASCPPLAKPVPT